MPEFVLIRKVAEEHGWLGNMSRFPLVWGGQTYKTAEHLFQCLRFRDPGIWEEIRGKSSPMQAKWSAKGRKAEMTVEPMSQEDLENMEIVLGLKLEQHPELRDRLLATGDSVIIEDCSKRPRGSGLFWGAAWKDGVWTGTNMLGKLWMKLREEVGAEEVLAAVVG